MFLHGDKKKIERSICFVQQVGGRGKIHIDFEVPVPERINNPIWLAYLGGVNVGVKVVKRVSRY